MIPAAGTTLAEGRYRLDRRLGAGGMASVWLAVDERLGREVAVKLISDTLTGDDRFLRRFEREARAAASVSGAGTVPILDYGVEGERPFIVMEYIRGGSLAERLADSSAPHPDPETVARELLGALARVHDAGIVHRDVKAANVLLDERGHVRLGDFGIAQLEDATALTQTGMLVGTIRYLAPEVLAGEPATPRSDLYSAGVVIREVAPDCETGSLGRLVEALTATDPDERPASATAALELLEEPVTPTPVEPVTRTRVEQATQMRVEPVPRARAEPVTRARVEPVTPTRVAAVTPGRPRSAADPGPRLSVGAALAAVAAAAVLIAFVMALAAGTDTTPSPPPAPAAAGAPLDRQIDGLQRIIDRAKHR